MPQTEGLRAVGSKVEWTLTPEQARQLAGVLEMADVDPFGIAKDVAFDLRREAAASQKRARGGFPMGVTP